MNRNDDIYTRTGVYGTWKHTDGKLMDISIGKGRMVWGVNKLHSLYSRHGVNGNWKYHKNSPKCQQVSATKDGRVCCTTKDRKFYYSDKPNTWVLVQNWRVKWIGCASGGNFWGIGHNDRIYHGKKRRSRNRGMSRRLQRAGRHKGNRMSLRLRRNGNNNQNFLGRLERDINDIKERISKSYHLKRQNPKQERRRRILAQILPNNN